MVFQYIKVHLGISKTVIFSKCYIIRYAMWYIKAFVKMFFSLFADVPGGEVDAKLGALRNVEHHDKCAGVVQPLRRRRRH